MSNEINEPFAILQLAFNSGDTIELPRTGATIFVGPNNSGKSATLRDINTLVERYRQPGEDIVSVSSVKIERRDAAAMEAWIRKHINITPNEIGQPGELIRDSQSGGTPMHLEGALEMWGSEPDSAPLRNMRSILVKYLPCETRLSFEGQVSRLDPDGHPNGLLQWLVTSTEALGNFRAAFKDAFGYNVIVDGWGSNLRLRPNGLFNLDRAT